MNEDDLRNSPVRHRWALVRFAQTLLLSEDEAVRDAAYDLMSFAQTLLLSEDEAVRDAAYDLIDELRSERYRGEFDVYDSQIQRNLRSERGG